MSKPVPGGEVAGMDADFYESRERIKFELGVGITGPC